MNENVFKRNELLATTVIKELGTRNIKGYYAKDKEEALKLALELILRVLVLPWAVVKVLLILALSM